MSNARCPSVEGDSGQPRGGLDVLDGSATRLQLLGAIDIHYGLGGLSSEKLERASRFAGWLSEHYVQVNDAAAGQLLPSSEPAYLSKIHRRLPNGSVPEDVFVDFASRMPFSQVLGDLADFGNMRAHDKDADMRGYIGEALSPQRGETLLDAGCSTGRTFLAYVDGVHCIGIDIDLASVLVGAHAWTAQPRNGKPTLCCGSILSVPIVDHSIDCVQSLVVLGYTPIRSALKEIRRVLKPGGRLAITLEGPGFLRELWEGQEASLKDKLGLARWYSGTKLQEAGLYWQGSRQLGRLAGIVLYTPASISRVLEANGFEVVDARTLRDYRGLPRVVGVTARSR